MTTTRTEISKTDARDLAATADLTNDLRGVRWRASRLQVAAARVMDREMPTGVPVALSCWPLTRVLRVIDNADRVETATSSDPADPRVLLICSTTGLGSLVFQVEG